MNKIVSGLSIFFIFGFFQKQPELKIELLRDYRFEIHDLILTTRGTSVKEKLILICGDFIKINISKILIIQNFFI